MEKEESSCQLDRNNVVSNEKKESWSDLPRDVVELIVRDFEVADLFRFQCVCKDWNWASQLVSSKFESIPWLLTYGTTAECSLITPSMRKLTIKIPELEGTTCIASNKGWLLFFNEGSMFFFCPFSRAKIDLPKFHCSDFKDHTATFSSPPTSEYCSICIIYKVDDTTWRLSSLHRGHDEWDHLDYNQKDSSFKTCRTAAYFGKSFHFLDDHHLLTHSFRNNKRKWNSIRLIAASEKNENNIDTLRYVCARSHYYWDKNMRKALDLVDGVSISLCGTLTHHGSYPMMIFNENIELSRKDRVQDSVKAVWLHSQLTRIPPTFKW